jgi:hypothetical protein
MALAFALGVLSLASEASAQGVFVTETVDGSPSTVGAYTSLARDVYGDLHLTYYDATAGDLMYAKKSEGSWTIERADEDGAVGAHTSLVLGTSGEVNVSYYDVGGGNLKWARRTGGGWDIETVDASANDVGQYTSMAHDPTDFVGSFRISYYDATAGDLKFASRVASNWAIEVVDAAGDVGSFTSDAVDFEGKSHVVYYDATNGALKYAKGSPHAWAIETVDDGGASNVGQYASMVLDHENNPHVAYYDASAGDLKYAHKGGGSWHIEVVDTEGDVGQHASIALDLLLQPQISYVSSEIDAAGGGSLLKFAHKLGGTWATQFVGEDLEAAFTSLELTELGAPLIGFQGSAEALSGDGGDALFTSFEPDTMTWRGRLHVGTGGAGVQLVGDACFVNNVGPSGLDGVTVLHESAQGFLVDIGTLGELGTFPIGAHFDVSTSGSVAPALAGGTPKVQPIGAVHFTDVEGEFGGERLVSVVADFGPVGSLTHTLELYLGGDLVYSASGLSGELMKLDKWPSGLASIIVGGPDAFAENRSGISAATRGVASVLIVDLGDVVGGPLQIDSFRIIADDPVLHVDTYLRFELHGADIVAFSIKEETLVPAIGVLLGTGVPSTLADGASLRIFPNPSAGGPINVSFRLPASQSVGLSVFDGAGRRVRSIEAGVLAAGPRSITWDGRDDSGRPVAAGAYFLRLDSGGERQAGRLMLIR